MIAYKLFRRRKDGSLGPLFINKRQRISPGVTYLAESHRTKGYAFRPGWHCALEPKAPHLTEKGRVWAKVEINDDAEHYARPIRQGGVWVLGKTLRILEILE